jgi:hypothetical protein
LFYHRQMMIFLLLLVTWKWRSSHARTPLIEGFNQNCLRSWKGWSPVEPVDRQARRLITHGLPSVGICKWTLICIYKCVCAKRRVNQ